MERGCRRGLGRGRSPQHLAESLGPAGRDPHDPRPLAFHPPTLGSGGGGPDALAARPGHRCDERRRRAIRLQCTDYLERHLFEDLGRKDEIPRDPALGGRTALYRLAELRRGARAIGEEMHRPTDTTGMFRDYARFGSRPHAGEALYRLLSALAHGKPWARVPASEHLALHQQPSGYQRMLAEAHMPTVAWTTEIVVRLAERALTDLERYSGAADRQQLRQ